MAVNKKNVLVVDDDKAMRSLLRDILSADGVDVTEAEDGQSALDVVQKHTVDLIITDRAMPGLSGLELLRELRRLKISVPAIMISAWGEESLWGESIGLGALDYLVKPFSAEAVLQVVRKNLFGGTPS